MELYYKIDGNNLHCHRTNEDMTIIKEISETRVKYKMIAKKDLVLVNCLDTIPFSVNYHDHYFLNGYQSWTDTKEFLRKKRLRNIKKSPHIITKKFGLDRYGDSLFYQYSLMKSHGYDFFYSKGEFELFIYNLNYKTAYLIFEIHKRKHNISLTSDLKGLNVKKGDEITILDYRILHNFELGLDYFNKDFKELNIEKLFGYSSWYNYYQNINEEIILRDLDALDSRFNVFQIDDGYETFVGDWLDVDPNKFPNGLKPIVDKIHQKGFKAGLWLAPFVAETKSKLFNEHPDWFKKDKKGKPFSAGGNWSGFYSLDLLNPNVLDYIKKCLVHYMDMGFDFFKLDFLYAAALPEYKGYTRSMVQYSSYKFLREILKDKLILGCGANIINSYQNFDYLRVGPDLSLKFDDTPIMRLFHRERISTKVTLQNTIFRSFFNGHLFGNDPDVFLLRDNNIELSLEQRKAVIKINALFGSVFMTSDNIAEYNNEKKEILNNALDLFYNGKVVNYKSYGSYIDITYLLHDIEHHFTYDINKGIIIKED